MKPLTTTKKKYVLEYNIKSAHHVLYEFLTTDSGLAQWFADEVHIDGDNYIFNWGGNKQRAKVVEALEPEFIRFRWENSNAEEYFEFLITTTEITGDTVLMITDFADSNEMKDAQLLWGSQVQELRARLGGL